jgi:hypothetical protein
VPFVFDRIAADCPELVPVVLRGILLRYRDIDIYLRLCEDSSENAHDNVMRVLKWNAAAAKPALPDLVNYLNKPPAWGIRPEFIELLGAMGPDAKAALPKLRELIDSQDFELALAAQGAIQKIEVKK